MLADPKAEALVSNFAGQWLYLRNLRDKVPNSFQFPDFDDDLRRAMVREVELFFQSVVDEDRGVLDLMTADYSFVNERLARHYGMPRIYGTQFRRVTVSDERRGLLGKGAILMATSHAHRTSPVLRGKWVLENIIGVSPAPPPDDVPALDDEERPEKPRSGRESLDSTARTPRAHRATACSIRSGSRSRISTPSAPGALETGERWATDRRLGTTGRRHEGRRRDGAASGRREPETFVRTFTEKLLTYAVGRGLTAADMSVVRSVVRDARDGNYRFSSLVLGIVHSAPFLMRTAGDQDRSR